MDSEKTDWPGFTKAGWMRISEKPQSSLSHTERLSEASHSKQNGSRPVCEQTTSSLQHNILDNAVWALCKGPVSSVPASLKAAD